MLTGLCDDHIFDQKGKFCRTGQLGEHKYDFRKEVEVLY